MEGVDGTTVDLIRAGVLAGAYGALARKHPDAAGGFEKLRLRWRGVAAALMDEIARAGTRAK